LANILLSIYLKVVVNDHADEAEDTGGEAHHQLNLHDKGIGNRLFGFFVHQLYHG